MEPEEMEPLGSGEFLKEHLSQRPKADRYRLILDSALDAIVAIDEEGQVVDWNKKAEALFGWSEKEAIGRLMADLIIPIQLRQAHHQGFQRFLTTGHGPILNRRIEIPAINREGREFPVELTVAAAQLAGRWMFTAFLRDMTAQKAIENRTFLQYECSRILAMSSDWREAIHVLIKGILERTPWEAGALWRTDSDSGGMICVEFLSLPDFPLRDWEDKRKGMNLEMGNGLIGQAWASRNPVWIRDLMEEARAVEGRMEATAGIRSYFAFPIVLDGRVIAVFEFLSRGIVDEDQYMQEALTSMGGQVGQFLQRCQAEEHLRDSQERLGLVFDNVNDQVSLFAVEGMDAFRCVEVNRKHLAAAGLEKEAMVGNRADEFMSATAYSAWLEKAQEVVATHRSIRFESEKIHMKNKRTLQQNWLPIPRRGANCTHILSIARDITETRIQEEALRHSQKMEAVGRLAGGIAHDFNNLLTVINGYSELGLARVEDGNALRGILEEIKKSGDRAAMLTSQLLAFSRRQILAPQVLDLNKIVGEMDTLLRRLIGEDVKLVTSLAPNLHPVRVDPGQMEQVILNLAINARDAMSQGGMLTLETANVVLDSGYVSTRLDATPGPHVMLTICDTGVGMPPEIKARLFEPFFTTKPRGKGTGMGLATVFGIVKQSGGNIHVYSEPGKGSIFKIYLPVVTEGPPAPIDNPGASVPETSGKGETILLTEDEEPVRTLIASALEGKGYRVLEAGNAEEAESIASREIGPIHLLLTDMMMPGAGGRSLAARIGRMHAESRVLFMSGYTDNAIVHNGELDRGTAFLQKPFSMDALAQKIRSILDSQSFPTPLS